MTTAAFRLADEDYEAIRLILVRFFQGRSFLDPESLADEVFTRIASSARKGRPIEDVRAYAMKVAVLVAHEASRVLGRERQLGDILKVAPLMGGQPLRQRQVLERLDRCLERLAPRERDLLLEYFEDTGIAKIDHHQRIASRLGITTAALRTRVHRLRKRVEVWFLAESLPGEGSTR